METMNLLTQAKMIHKRNFIVSSLVLVVILAFATFLFLPYTGTLMKPPRAVDFNALYLESLEDTKLLYDIPADFNNIYTFETVYLDENEVITDYFMALINNEGNFVLAEIPAKMYEDESITSYVGHFTQIEDDVYGSILEDLQGAEFTYEEAVEMMPDKIFVLEDNRAWLWVIFALIFLGYLLLFYQVMKLLALNSMSAYHKVASKFGDSESVLRELELCAVNSEHANFGLTKNYVVMITNKKIKLIPMNDVVWAYEKIVKKKLYFLITINKIHSLIVATKDTRAELSLRKGQIQAALGTIEHAMPWIVIGYNTELEKIYNKEKERFASEVRMKKNSMTDET